MDHVYLNQGQGLITLGVTTFDRFYNLPLKIFHTFFLRTVKSYKVETWYTQGEWVDVFSIPKSGPRAHNFWR